MFRNNKIKKKSKYFKNVLLIITETIPPKPLSYLPVRAVGWARTAVAVRQRHGARRRQGVGRGATGEAAPRAARAATGGCRWAGAGWSRRGWAWSRQGSTRWAVSSTWACGCPYRWACGGGLSTRALRTARWSPGWMPAPRWIKTTELVSHFI